MDNQPNINQSEHNSMAGTGPAQNVNDSSRNQGAGKPHQKNARRTALILLISPLIFYIIVFGARYLLTSEGPTQGSGQFTYVEIQQHPIVPILSIVTFLTIPISAIMIITGFILLINSLRPYRSISVNQVNKQHNKSSYKSSIFILIAGIILMLSGFLVIHMTHGSMAGVAGLPFLFSGSVTIIVSVVMLIITFIRKLILKKINQS